MVELDLLLDLTVVILLGYSLYFGFKLTKKLYGGRFTSVLPELIGVITLLFIQRLIEAIFEFLPREAGNIEFIFALQTLQIMAGVFLIRLLHQLYQTGFATSGIFRGK